MDIAKPKLKIAVCGSATGKFDKEILKNAYHIGETIVKNGVMVVTGATTGYPYEAAKGAVAAGGVSLGISPAVSAQEHVVKYQKPLDAFDPCVFTGLGLRGRNMVILQTADAAIFIAGGTGTLNEFSIAYDVGKPIGVLVGSGGLEHMIEAIVQNNYKKPPIIVRNADPEKLVNNVLSLIKP